MTTTIQPPGHTQTTPLPTSAPSYDLLPPPELRKGLRRSQGLTQEQAAALFGVSDGSISNWEQRKPGPRHMRAYLEKLLEWAAAARAMGFHVNWPAPAEPQK